MEGDAFYKSRRWEDFVFQSTPSAWRETSFCAVGRWRCFISIHSLRMEGDAFCKTLLCTCSISIHSLRMEGDTLPVLWITCGIYFNPLPPHGGRQCSPSKLYPKIYFNPLPPHGGRLRTMTDLIISMLFQSTPSAWRETKNSLLLIIRKYISIHSLRMEGDQRDPCAF